MPIEEEEKSLEHAQHKKKLSSPTIPNTSKRFFIFTYFRIVFIFLLPAHHIRKKIVKKKLLVMIIMNIGMNKI